MHDARRLFHCCWWMAVVFTERWREVSTDTWVLEAVSDGYALEFTSKLLEPLLEDSKVQEPIQTSDETQSYSAPVGHLSHRACNTESKEKGCLFNTVPKKNRDTYVILDLKWLNKFLKKKNFQNLSSGN